MSTDNSGKNLYNYLGIDYGQADVGLAIADSETKIAFSHGALKNDKQLFNRLKKIVDDENIKKIVIGIPSYINRESVEYESENFGNIIENILGIEVAYQDEMFTTKMARSNLVEKGVKGLSRFDDAEAARIILQEWLDRKNRHQ